MNGRLLKTMGLCIALLLAGGCSGTDRRTIPAGPGTASCERADAQSALCGQKGAASRIILNLTTMPATSMAVTWRTDGPVVRARAQIVPATGSARFDEKARTVEARSRPLALKDGRTVQHHEVVFDDLAPSTLYAYRLGSEGGWSEWSQFETAAAAPAAFRFVYFGDPQEAIQSKCPRLFRSAYRKVPDADFWLFVGDLVNDGERDEQWSGFFDALGWIPRTTPMILLPGNHEYPDKRFVHGAGYRLSPLWRPHFTLPQNGPAGLEETVYFIDYQGARIVMLNGNEQLTEQARWLDRILAANPQRWTIVAIHQPMYSAGKRGADTTLEQLLVPIFDRHGVDLVLQGHHHRYARSAKLRNGARAIAGESGTVYVVSVSGPKSYPANPRYSDLMEKSGAGVQLFQVIEVCPERLAYRSFDAAGALFDAFVLEK